MPGIPDGALHVTNGLAAHPPGAEVILWLEDGLFVAAVAAEAPPWVGDATVFALAHDLEPLVAFREGRYELTPAGTAVLAGTARRPVLRD